MIVSDVSDNSIMVQNGENGFLFNPYEEKEIAYAIKHFILFPIDKRREMSTKSRQRAETLFDRNAFLSRYLSLI